MKNLTLALTLLALVACGGGGGGASGESSTKVNVGGGSVESNTSASTSAASKSFNGTAMDGYLYKATVFLDLNDNGKFDAGEPTATTSETGAFTLSATQEQINTYKVVVVAVAGTTIDQDSPNTTVTSGYTMMSPPGNHEVVSPLTTQVVAKMSTGLSLANAKTAVQDDLGLTAIDVMKNYVAAKATDTNYSKAHNVAASLAEVLKTVEAEASKDTKLADKLANIITKVTSQIVPKIEQIKAASSTALALQIANSTVLGVANLAGTFNYYRDGSTNNPVSFMYARDIDGDGIDEVFFIAFETQPNTPNAYSNTSVHIFGWEAGVFKEITSKWLPNDTHLIEGAGDMVFGDFNGDGKTDIFLSAYTDMNHPVNAYALINEGGTFLKVSLGQETWQHGVAVADINGDGYDDVIAAGYSDFSQYLGSPAGLVKYKGMVGSSGVALGDFLGNGQKQAIFVDAGSGSNDTFLYSIQINNNLNIVGFTKIGTLPGPVLTDSHDIRARAIDFDRDGKLDVVVFSYKSRVTSDTERRSEVQFLKNMGGGQFADVTSTVRVGYTNNSGMGYAPVFRDFNGDGLLDLFFSGPDWRSNNQHISTTLLLQQANGTFKESFKAELSQAIESGGGQAVLSRGPNQSFYLIKETAWKRDGLTRVYVQKANFLSP